VGGTGHGEDVVEALRPAELRLTVLSYIVLEETTLRLPRPFQRTPVQLSGAQA
jgi:hypothetical protein